ncbi:MAG: phage shock protein PspA [Proteobacteria bacterium]|uniref:Phage shock protein A (PspA) family protein n=2 Tax=Desulfomicrobium TaxID=898 RepID=A0A8G2C5P8_DESNO|nr:MULTISPECIES: phage shock protein PspA [Desulfomicrobium]MBE1426773.1 phage shock protein A [Desulfomicrobium macestii]NCC06403.1 phage shock protein PspA [Pseudomonadota bacterium]SFM14234.1 phage shock protein A (PspA) family protein [Desulfomicrobium norvegicum]
MGVFTRFKDIISSNINSMLDKAEEPEKMIRLMIQEMEETSVELKAACAGLMADQKRIAREQSQALARLELWEDRAKLALDKGREDLAREALLEKLAAQRLSEGLERERDRFAVMIEQAREDIEQLDVKLESAKERQRSLAKRHVRADQRIKVRSNVSRVQSADVMMRFDQFEQRIERMEAEAELGAPRQNRNLEQEFALLEGGDEVEAQLASMRSSSDK